MSLFKDDCSREDFELIVKIAERAEELGLDEGRSRIDRLMDIECVHCNDTPLALQAFLDAPEGDFRHDFNGIIFNLDRTANSLKTAFHHVILKFITRRTNE